MAIIRWPQSFTAGQTRVELHQMRGTTLPQPSLVLCQDLIGRTGRRKVTMSMLDARRQLPNMDIKT
ncbi:hypothetical protein D6B98_09495 [Bradyrhizobium sp. LVM 105]|nr:hypothetical protein D6B98_09495 [Bradyrhizobium sp. LVM 105]